MGFASGGNRLERWLAEHEHEATHLLAHSGVETAPPSLVPGIEPGMNWGYGKIPQSPELVAAIAERYDVPPEEVLVTVGASEADLLVYLSLLEPGDPVLVESPTYPPLREVPRALGARVLDLRREPEDGFSIRGDDVEEGLEAGARLVVVTDPHNPSCVGLGSARLRELAERCEDHGAWLLVDEVYHELQREPRGSARSLHPRILATHSLTKCHGLPGLRTGWLLAPEEVMGAAREAKASTTIANPPVLQEVAHRVLEDPGPLLERAVDRRERNLPLLRDAAADLGLGWVEPAAGVAATVKLPEGVDDEAFARDLLGKQDVLVVPGSFLGCPGWLRMGFGGEPEAFRTALQRFVEHGNHYL